MDQSTTFALLTGGILLVAALYRVFARAVQIAKFGPEMQQRPMPASFDQPFQA